MTGVDVARRIIYISGEIDSVMAHRVIMALQVLDAESGPMRIILNSMGGDEQCGYAIYDAITTCKNTATVDVYGQCLSIATVILQAGSVRRISVNSEFMMHHGTVPAMGGDDDDVEQDKVVKLAEELKAGNKKYYRVLAEKSKQTEDSLHKWCKQERYFTATEAVELGFADAVIRPVPPGAVGLPLGSGNIAIIDAEDLEKVSPYAWNVGNGRYAASGSFRLDGKQIWVKLHRFLVDATDDEVVDHINGDTFDCRKSNLRKCTTSDNNKNRGKQKKTSSSKFKGVHRRLKGGWVARIQVNGKRISLGDFSDEVDAARAYDAAAKLHHGSFAKLNFKPSSGENK